MRVTVLVTTLTLLVTSCVTGELRRAADKHPVPADLSAGWSALDGTPWTLPNGESGAGDSNDTDPTRAHHQAELTPAALRAIFPQLDDALFAKAQQTDFRVSATISEREALTVFLARNEQLRSAWRSREGARHRHGQVLALKRLAERYEGFSGRPDEPRPTATPPTPDMLQARVVEADVALEGVRFEATALDLARALRVAFHGARFQSHAASVLADSVSLAKRLVGVARVRFVSNRASSTDVLRAEMRLESLRRRLKSARERRDAARRTLGALLNAGARVTPGTSRKRPSRGALAEVREAARTHGPDVLAATLRHRRAEAMLELAERKLQPGWTLGTAERRGEPGRERFRSWEVGAAPFLEELRSQVGSAAKARQQAESLVPAAAEQAHAELGDASRRVRLYQSELIPRAQQSLKTIEKEYRVAKASWLELDDAQRLWLESKLGLHEAVQDVHIAAATLLRITGGTDRQEEK